MRYLNSKKLAAGLMPIIGLFGIALQKKIDDKKLESPNVILILADDLGYGDLSCYGQKILSTPQIDRMAHEGMLFTQMYSGSTVSAPSRACLMTGKNTGYASVRANNPDQLVGDDELTLGKVFKNAGYVTGAIGKWGLGHPPPPDDPYKKGFDYFYGYINMYHAHNYYPEFLYENGRKVMLNNKLATVNGVNPWADQPEGTGVSEVKNEYTHDLFNSHALEFIEKNRDKKFFLYLPFTVPHENTEGWNFSGDGMEVPDYYEFKKMDWPTPEKGYAAMIRNMDNSVGMIIDKLKELGLDRKTLVIFTSDNGPQPGSQPWKHQVEFFNSNGELRDTKWTLYEGGIRVPFIARWPGVIPEGTRSVEQFAFWDFLPTFADLISQNVPDSLNGISFLPTLLGNRQTEKHDYLYWEHYNWNFAKDGAIQAIRKAKWKALKLNVSASARKEVFELYNLETDPGETNNVANQYPELVKEFSELFLSARKEFKIQPLFPKN